MKRLPLELHDTIADLCNDDDRRNLVRVSRSWQQAVERQTFRHIDLASTDLHGFESIVTGRRRTYIQTIDYSIILPTYSEEARCRFERESDREANDEAFTASLSSLFRILGTWSECSNGSISFKIKKASSPSDPEQREPFFLSAVGPDDEARKSPRYIGHRRYRYSRLRLLHSDDLLPVPCVGSFDVFEFNLGRVPRAIAHSSLVHIAAKFPYLRNCSWCVGDWDLCYPFFRRQNRMEFAEAVRDILPAICDSEMEKLNINIFSPMIWDPNAITADLTASESPRDPLSHAIREATAHAPSLSTLRIGGVVDESLFWPDLSSSIAEPFWQHLQILDAGFDLTTASGNWHFVHPRRIDVESKPISSNTGMPPGHGFSEEEDVEFAWQFSDKEHGERLADKYKSGLGALPNEQSVVPLMEAFAQACRQIPCLRMASLRANSPAPTDSPRLQMSPWGVWYLAPEQLPPEPIEENLRPSFYEGLSRRRLIWEVKGWEPDPRVREIFQSVGQERHGEALSETFIKDEPPSQGLAAGFD